jgi:hypothetical protein
MPTLYPMMELMPVAVLQARMTSASRKGITNLRCSSDSRTRLPVGASARRARVSSISRNSSRPARAAGAQQRGVGLVLFAAAEEPARRLADHQAADHEEQPGGSETQKMLRQA